MHAEKWLINLFRAIASLEESPKRCNVIPESEELGFSVRQLLFGRDHGVYRIIFDIREDTRMVRLLRVWHGSRGAIKATDVEDTDSEG